MTGAAGEVGRGGAPKGILQPEAQSPGFLGPLVAGLCSFQLPGGLECSDCLPQCRMGN